MAKLVFYYSVMNSGKSTNLIQKAYNYEECGLKVLVMKPSADTKIKDSISTRINLVRKVDVLIGQNDLILEKLRDELKSKKEMINAIFIEEAQFLSSKQIDELSVIASCLDIEVLCYGLRTDFTQKGFDGSNRLLARADTLIAMETKCKLCGDNATNNARKINDKYVSEGSQVSIDGVDSSYDSLCELCYAREVLGVEPEKIKTNFYKSIE